MHCHCFFFDVFVFQTERIHKDMSDVDEGRSVTIQEGPPPRKSKAQAPMCTTDIRIIRSSQRDRAIYPSASKYTIPLGSLVNVYAVSVLHVAFPTTPMTIEAADDFVVACDQAHKRACIEAERCTNGASASFRDVVRTHPGVGTDLKSTSSFGNSAVVIGEGFPVLAGSPPVNVQEVVDELSTALLFDMPVTLIGLCPPELDDDRSCTSPKECDPSPFACNDCHETDGVRRFCTAQPHGCLRGDKVFVLGLDGCPTGGPFCVEAAPTRDTLCLRMPGYEGCGGGSVDDGCGLHMYRPPPQQPQVHASLLGDRFGRFVQTHYTDFGIKVSRGHKDEPAPCGKPIELQFTAGTILQTLDGAFRCVLARHATTSEFVTGRIIALVTRRDRTLETGELLEVATGIPCNDVLLCVATCVEPYRTPSTPSVVWCAPYGVFEATIGLNPWVPQGSVRSTITTGLSDPYAICQPVTLGAPAVPSARNAVAWTSRMHLLPGYYQSAREVGSALFRAVNPPTLDEGQWLVYETEDGEKKGFVVAGTFSAEGAMEALQSAVCNDAKVVLCEPESIVAFRSDDPFFFIDTARNPWLVAFGFDPTGCNRRVCGEGFGIAAKFPINTRRREGGTGACGCGPADTLPPLDGIYGVRVSPRDAGSLSLVLEPGTVRGVLGVSKDGCLKMTLDHFTHLLPHTVVRIGGSPCSSIDGLHVISDIKYRCVKVRKDDKEDDAHEGGEEGKEEEERGKEEEKTLRQVLHFATPGCCELKGQKASMRPAVNSFGVFAQNVQDDSGGVTGFQTDQPVGACHEANAPVIVPPTCTVLIRIDGVGGQVNAMTRTGPGPHGFTNVGAVASAELTRDRPGTCAFPHVISASCPNGARNGQGCMLRELSIELLTPDGRPVDFHGADHTLTLRLDQV